MSTASETLARIHDLAGAFHVEVRVERFDAWGELNFNVALSRPDGTPLGPISYNGRSVEEALERALADLQRTVE